MTVEQEIKPEEVVVTKEVSVASAIVETASAATKRSFEEMQARAMTIHDIEEDDDENDGEYIDDIEEEEEEAEEHEAVEDDEDDHEFEADEEVTVEEITAIVEESGIKVPDGAELTTKVLRHGKKIVDDIDLKEAAQKARDLLESANEEAPEKL